jgi:hypothetical protein
MVRILDRKNFSHRRTNFPSRSSPHRLASDQRMGEFQAEKMVTINMGYAHSTSSQDTRSLGKGVAGNQGCAGYLQQNLRGEWQRAPDGDQGASCGNIQCGGEFQQLLAVLIAAADKNGNRQRQAWPLPAFSFRGSSLQPHPSRMDLTHSLPHLVGQTVSRIWTSGGAKPLESTLFRWNGPTKTVVVCPWLCHLFAIFQSFSEVSEYFRMQAFALP